MVASGIGVVGSGWGGGAGSRCRGSRCRGSVQGAAAGTGASALVRRRRRRLRSVVDEGAGGRAGTAAAVLGRGRNAASRRAAVAGGQVCRHGSLVVGSGFPLDEGDGVGGAGRQAVAQPVAVVVAHQARLAVDHGDGTLVARVDAQAAAGALVLVDVNNLAEHGTSFASCRISGSIIAGQRESARASMQMMESCGRTPTRPAAASTFSTLVCRVSLCSGRMSAFRITSVRMPWSARRMVASRTTAMTSSHSPSISVNIEVVRWGSPESRMTRMASAT